VRGRIVIIKCSIHLLSVLLPPVGERGADQPQPHKLLSPTEAHPHNLRATYTVLCSAYSSMKRPEVTGLRNRTHQWTL
jgi:hypothetical protein